MKILYLRLTATKEKKKDRLRKANNNQLNFLVVADAYSREILGISLFGKKSNLTVLDELRMLRNSYVHNGCSLNNLSERTRENILDGNYEKYLGQYDEKWYVNPKGVSLFFKEADEAFKYFQRYAFANLIT